MTNPLNEPFSIFWFRRDLRLVDNHGLFAALSGELPVLPIFIFDSQILKSLPRQDARVEFIHSTLESMNTELKKVESSIQVFHGAPAEVWPQILKKYPVKQVYFNEDYEPYARERDQKIADICRSLGVEVHTSKDQVIFGPREILKDNGEPYRVYTPYSRKWLGAFESLERRLYPSEKRLNRFLAATSKLPSLAEIGFEPSDTPIPSPKVSDELLKGYAASRDLPAIAGTSRLGLHLRFGTISPRRLVERAHKNSAVFLKELIWREFFMQILFHFPHSAQSAFDPRYDSIEWLNDKKQFRAWCEGRTGYPMVDAGMRELNATGFMHNRVRMVTASFLCKHLLIDWRWGERYFAEKLLDFDLSANVGNWQWAAGSGCDAAPYFRVFNPALQAKKFDPKGQYIKKWVPEVESAEYPEPIVNHEVARGRALAAYKKALKG